MSSISNRVVRLEDAMSAGDRVIVSSHVHDMTDAQLEALLRAHGISPAPDDLVVSLKRLTAGDEASWVSVDGKMITQLEADRHADRN